MFQLDKNKQDQPVSYYTIPDYKQLSKDSIGRLGGPEGA